MEVINLTGRHVIILNKNAEFERAIVHGDLPEIETVTESVGDIQGIPVTRNVLKHPESFPDSRYDALYIVSNSVKNALPGREDLLCLSEIVQGCNGRTIGGKSLSV